MQISLKQNHPFPCPLPTHETLLLLMGTGGLFAAVWIIFVTLDFFERKLLRKIVAFTLLVSFVLFFLTDFQGRPPASMQWINPGAQVKTELNPLETAAGSYDGVVLNSPDASPVENDLVVKFPRPLHTAIFLVTEPEWTRAADATTAAEKMDIGFYDSDAPETEIARITLTPDQVSRQGWIKVAVTSAATFSQLEVRIIPGASALKSRAFISLIETPHLLIGVGRFSIISLQVLVLTIFFIALAQLIWGAGGTKEARQDGPGFGWVVLVLFLSFNLFAVAWLGLSRYVFALDFVTYPNLASHLATTIQMRGIVGALNAVITSIRTDYNSIPVFPISLLETLLQSDCRCVYQLGVWTFYVVPTVLAMARLARLLTHKSLSSTDALAVTLLSVLLFPIILYPGLYGYLDIGGVLIISLIFVFLLDREAEDETAAAVSIRQIWRLIAVGGLIVLLCLFRRWFLFTVPPITLIVVAYELARARKRGALSEIKGVLASILPILVMACFIALALITFYAERLVVMVSNNYRNAYTLWWSGTNEEIHKHLQTLGLVPLSLGVISLIFLLAHRPTRMFAVSAAFLVIFSISAFTRVQGFTIQHFLLYVPVIALVTSVTLITLGDLYPQWRRLIWVLFAGLGLLATLSPFRSTPGFAWDRFSLFPQAYSLAPPQRDDLVELNRLGFDLAQAAKDGKHFGVLSNSFTLNGSIVTEVAKNLDPQSAKAFQDEYIYIGVTDRVEGPALAFPLCDLVVLAEPVQIFKPSEQQAVYYLSEQILSGEGLGASYRRTDAEYHLDGGVTAYIYEKESAIPDDEWQKYLDAVHHK